MQDFLLFLIVMVGSLVTGLSGFGGGSIVLAGMMIIYPPELAIPLHAITQVFANGNRVIFFFKHILWKTVLFYSILMFPASLLGAYLFDHFNSDFLKILVGTFILISILPLKFEFIDIPRNHVFVILGALSGFLSVFVGAIGPLVTPFFNRLPTTRTGNLSTKSAGQLFLQFAKLTAFTGISNFSFEGKWGSTLIILTGSVLGVFISHMLSKKISDEIFNKVINLLLTLTAIKIIYEGIKGLIIS